MKKLYVFISTVFVLLATKGQASNIEIPQSQYVIMNFTTDNSNHPASDAFDSDTVSWWATFNSGGYSLPSSIEINLSASYDVSGFSYLPNAASVNDKADDYEIYVSTDGVTWGSPQTTGSFSWINQNDTERRNVYFGAIKGQYVKVVFLSNTNPTNDNIHTCDLIFFESTSPATGQQNQLITFSPIGSQITTNAPITLNASASSGLPITYSIISGPASISGNLLTLDGTGGTVEVRAYQAGDASYYEVESFQYIEVIDLSIFYPVVQTRLTDAYDLEMPVMTGYPIYASATIDQETYLSITNMEIEVNGTSIPTTYTGDYCYALWTPDVLGTYTISIIAHGSNGNTTTETKTINVTDQTSSQTTRIFDNVVINYGSVNSRNYSGTYEMPQSIGAYNQIIAHLNFDCPSVPGGCDDWDRRCHIEITTPNGDKMEIIRYMTPYGVACSHDIDLTSYESILQGEVEFSIFIDTWGSGGWQVTLDLEYIQGTPTYPYSTVTEIWDGSFSFGNLSNLYPLDTINYTFPDNTAYSELRIMNTGHSWGQYNSQNAAEFYHAENYIYTDNTISYTHDLWNDCNPNPDNCTGQMGTWYYSRAGWCPGAISHPATYNLSQYIANSSVELAYIFDTTYVDYCSPANPDCKTGVTCADCNAGSYPKFHIDGHIINYSNSPLILNTTSSQEVNDYIHHKLDIFPNPSQNEFQITSNFKDNELDVSIYRIDGARLKHFVFINNEHLNAYKFNISELSNGVYFIIVESQSGNYSTKLIKN